MGGATLLGNWATEWQERHVENVGWYICSSAHSQPLNANLKAYAAWHLWVHLAGWEPDVPIAGVIIEETGDSTSVIEGGIADSYTIALNSQPSDVVVITITPDSQFNVGEGGGVYIEVTFTRDNWDISQSVAVFAVDDGVLGEDLHPGLITHRAASNDLNYADIAIQSVNVSITDNDNASHMPIGGILLLLGSDVP